MTLPKRYIEDIRQMPHVRLATWANWFGGKDPTHDREFFANFAVDPATYLAVYSEIGLPPERKAAWLENRRGAIVGDVLAKKMGWKVGDKVTLESGIYPELPSWEFTIEGVYDANAKSVDRSSFFFHWAYLNDALPPARKDHLGWIVSRVDDPAQAADVSVGIDKRFDEKETPTLSQDERAFNTSFLASFSAVLKALDVISLVILLIMALLVGNTIAMGVRERTHEYGALRAIGFMPGHLVMFVLGESMLMGMLGGVFGLALAYPLVEKVIGRVIEENMGSWFPYFRVDLSVALSAFVLSVAIGAAAAALPAWQVSKLKIVDALRRVA
jgi:putative ABC transport system permease protein